VGPRAALDVSGKRKTYFCHDSNPWPYSARPNRYTDWAIAALNSSSITTIKTKVKEILPPTRFAFYKNITVTNVAFSEGTLQPPVDLQRNNIHTGSPRLTLPHLSSFSLTMASFGWPKIRWTQVTYLEYFIPYGQNDLFCTVSLYAAIFGNIIPTLNENYQYHFLLKAVNWDNCSNRDIQTVSMVISSLFPFRREWK
jgi:hypothetical protein